MKAIIQKSIICGGNFRNHGRPGETLFESRHCTPSSAYPHWGGSHCLLRGRQLESRGPEEWQSAREDRRPNTEACQVLDITRVDFLVEKLADEMSSLSKRQGNKAGEFWEGLAMGQEELWGQRRAELGIEGKQAKQPVRSTCSRGRENMPLGPVTTARHTGWQNIVLRKIKWHSLYVPPGRHLLLKREGSLRRIRHTRAAETNILFLTCHSSHCCLLPCLSSG